MNRKALCLTSTLVAAVGFATAPVDAALMVDFENVTTVSGWQTIEDVTPPVVTDTSHDLGDGITLTFAGDWRNSGEHQNLDGSSSPDDSAATDGTASKFAGTNYEDVVRDYFWGTQSAGEVSTFTIAGLDNEAVYSLTLLNARATTGDTRQAKIVANGSPADNASSFEDTPGSNIFHAYEDGWVDGTALVWDNLTPDASGEIVVSFSHYSSDPDASGSSNYFINGFTLVPEPASLALLGMGGLMMLGRRRA